MSAQNVTMNVDASSVQYNEGKYNSMIMILAFRRSDSCNNLLACGGIDLPFALAQLIQAMRGEIVCMDSTDKGKKQGE